MSDAPNAIESEAVGRLLALRESIALRARDCEREPELIKLVAVSKTYSADEVWPTIATAGQTCFGENRVQEAIPKWRDLRARAAALGKAIELHLIGPLQSNKAREAVETFDVIEQSTAKKSPRRSPAKSTGSANARACSSRSTPEANRRRLASIPEEADAFIALCRQTYGLAIEGLMAIPPANELVSPHFALLGVIAERNGLSERSMGMSADWPLAVQLGATYVRVGSAIFGERDSSH